MDLNHRSPGYEPDGISRLPHLVMQTAELTYFQTTDGEIILLTQKLYEKKDFIGIVLSTNATHQVACEALQDGLSYCHCCSAQQC